MDQRSKDPFALINEHILLPFANAIEAADEAMTAVITEEVIKANRRPCAGRMDARTTLRFATIAENRQAYVDYLTRRLEAASLLC